MCGEVKDVEGTLFSFLHGWIIYGTEVLRFLVASLNGKEPRRIDKELYFHAISVKGLIHMIVSILVFIRFIFRDFIHCEIRLTILYSYFQFSILANSPFSIKSTRGKPKYSQVLSLSKNMSSERSESEEDAIPPLLGPWV